MILALALMSSIYTPEVCIKMQQIHDASIRQAPRHAIVFPIPTACQVTR